MQTHHPILTYFAFASLITATLVLIAAFGLFFE